MQYLRRKHCNKHLPLSLPNVIVTITVPGCIYVMRHTIYYSHNPLTTLVITMACFTKSFFFFFGIEKK